MAQQNSVKRSLYYYDFSWMVYKKDEDKYKSVKNINTKVKNFFSKFDISVVGSIEEKYKYKTENEDTVFIITDEINTDTIKFRIVVCKTNALPQVENAGTLEDLEKYIDRKKNIADVTHCVYFRDSNVIGAEFNFSGARVSMLRWYIPRVLHDDGDTENIYSVRVDAKINGDAYAKLKKNEDFSLFELHFKPDSDAYRKVLANTSLFKGVVSSTPDADIIEVTLKKRKTKKGSYTGLGEILTSDQIKELIKYHREDIKKLYVSQGTYSDGIDLLSDKLVSKVDLIKTQQRTIDRNDAYRKIKAFYDEEVKPE